MDATAQESRKISCDDTLTLAAIGIAAYVFADVVHECLGHGIACLATGGEITLLTSVLFRSEPPSRITDAAGPCANLLAGALLWLVLRYGKSSSVHTRLFLLLGMAFYFFWAAGYFIYSGIAYTGDWAFLISDFQPAWFSRSILVLLGIFSYHLFLRVVVLNLRNIIDSTESQAPQRLMRLLFIPYLAAGIAACIAAMFSRYEPTGAIAGAAREAFLTNLPLSILPLSLRASGTTVSVRPGFVTRNMRWIFSIAVIFAVFVAILGRGLTFSA